ncbi:50S ribosomal protein L7/L12 [Rhodanobacter sp. 115]|nr:50S ribosomal protein L7/L12 [Rhodanobacter sp. 115]
MNFSASSLEAASFTTPPASVRSFASFRPRPVMARTALITSTFLSPGLFRITSNSVCASAAGAAAPAAATATGAAADTPNFSSMAFTSSITSMSDLAATASTISSLVRDILIYLWKWIRF